MRKFTCSSSLPEVQLATNGLAEVDFFETNPQAGGLSSQDMNRFCLKPKVNPAFKVAQPLPALIAIPGLKPPGALPGRAAVPLPPTEGRLDLPAMGLDEKSCDPASEPTRYNSLCKNFAFTSLPQVV